MRAADETSGNGFAFSIWSASGRPSLPPQLVANAKREVEVFHSNVGLEPFLRQQIQQYERDDAASGLAWARVVENSAVPHRRRAMGPGGRQRRASATSRLPPRIPRGRRLGRRGGVRVHVDHPRAAGAPSTVSRAAAGRPSRSSRRTWTRSPGDRADAGREPAPARTLPDDGVGHGACGSWSLNKADLSDDPEGECAAIRRRLPHVDVVSVSALADDGLSVLSPYLQPARPSRSGCPASASTTLINRLLGGERLAVGPVRESDGRGRHTTTSRQLVELPGGALLIDTPGMRELRLVRRSSVQRAFDDIAELAQGCRFEDCAHGSSPAARDGGVRERQLETIDWRTINAYCGSGDEARNTDKAGEAEVKRR